MCGRFTLSSSLYNLKGEFSESISGNFPAKYNISPGQSSVVISLKENEYRFHNIEWGLKLNGINRLIINARSETVNEKKIFSQFFKYGRCLIPANSWFEWPKPKKPYLIKNRKKNIICFAGLRSLDVNGNQKFIIITSKANGILKSIHSRTPTVVDKKHYLEWLGDDYERALSILKPLNDDNYFFYQVSPEIGDTSNDYEQLIEINENDKDNMPLFTNLV